MSEIQLLPCPFCGGEAELNYARIQGEDKGYWAQVICKKCHGRSGGIWAGSYNAAERKEVKAWNTRKPVDDIVEQIREESDVVKNRYGIEFEGIAMDAAIDIVRSGGKE